MQVKPSLERLVITLSLLAYCGWVALGMRRRVER
jgi:hypothetical protein